MTAVRYVTEVQMERKTGMRGALGYAFPDEDLILLQNGMPKPLEMEVRAHEAEHIRKGEEGPFLGSLIGAGASILGGIMSSNSASRATRAQKNAANRDLEYQRETRDLGLELTAPQREASYAATAAMMDMTGLSRTGRAMTAAGGSANAPSLSDYDQYEFTKDPGYDFRLSESMRALQRGPGGAAGGGVSGGGYLRRAIRYASDYASNEYMNVYNRLGTLAGYGSTANSTAAGVANNTAANTSGTYANLGAARASGYTAQGNAWSNVINQIGGMDWGKILGRSSDGGDVWT